MYLSKWLWEAPVKPSSQAGNIALALEQPRKFDYFGLVWFWMAVLDHHGDSGPRKNVPNGFGVSIAADTKIGDYKASNALRR